MGHQVSGIGNKPYHQYIIADLIFGIRKSLLKQYNFPEFMVLPEFSIGNYAHQRRKLSKGYNFDLCIVNPSNEEVLMIVEVTNMGETDNVIPKIKDCLKNIDSLEEAFIIEWDEDGNTIFTRYFLEGGKIEKTKTSKSAVIGYSLKASLVSLK